MKNIITLLSFFLIITSCDVIEGPYKISEENIVTTDTNTYVKKILIEDFTGHRCKNCPNAARELEAIHEFYGNQIIGMAIHVTTGYARPSVIGTGKFEYDFRTQWGTNWYNYFELSDPGLPTGMVNRTNFPTNHKLGKDEWLARVITELEKDIDFGIIITTEINESTLTINTNTEILNNINGNYNLVICITESNIINWQTDGQIENESYIHNHVLRALVSDNNLASSTVYNSGDQISHPHTIDLNILQQSNIDYSLNAEAGNGNAGGWNYSNMSVIAYIYDNISEEILQVEEINLNN
jgi:hypothetical protein